MRRPPTAGRTCPSVTAKETPARRPARISTKRLSKSQAVVVNANAADLPLGDETVDLIVTSPPYFALRDYKDGGGSLDGQIGAEATPHEFLEALWACSAEWWRVLKPGGALWVNLGDKYSSGGRSTYDTDRKNEGRGGARSQDGARPKSLLGLPWRYAIGMTDGKGDPDGRGWVLRAEVIWAKPNGLPESVRDRVRRSHEQWFHFTKSERYYSAVDLIRQPHKANWAKGVPTPSAGGRQGDTPTATGDSPLRFPHPLGALPGSVWTVPTEPLKVPDELGVDHFAAFPTEWPRRIILGWAPTKGVCTTCGEGLRPDTAKRASGKPTTSAAGGFRSQLMGEPERKADRAEWAPGVSRTTTGWACACDTPGKTRPAVVLDPFGGTGTTAAVAKALGCVGISVDLSADYCRLAEWRTNGDGYLKVQDKVHRASKH